MHPNVHFSTICNSQDMEATKCPPTEDPVKKFLYIDTMEYYLAIKRNKIVLFAEMCVYLEIVIQNKISQKEKTNII